jgi:hypothetical protein
MPRVRQPAPGNEASEFRSDRIQPVALNSALPVDAENRNLRHDVDAFARNPSWRKCRMRFIAPSGQAIGVFKFPYNDNKLDEF